MIHQAQGQQQQHGAGSSSRAGEQRSPRGQAHSTAHNRGKQQSGPSGTGPAEAQPTSREGSPRGLFDP